MCQQCRQQYVPSWVHFIREAKFLGGKKHFGDETVEKFAEVTVSVDLEAVRHDLARQAVAAEQRLHAVGDLHLTTDCRS